MVVFVVGCAADPSPPMYADEVDPIIAGKADLAGGGDDAICELAAALPADDPCSTICDPDALREAMIAAGYQGGRCYLLECQLSDQVSVGAGACLP